ncbi:MAG: peptidase S8/S53 subtilisin kexin sedolisin [Planctomycetaceae bacterium]|nr:peptidase S8/S53 subtilisin kexin sedolisin [Planctomycetaceae bacterium]
MAKSAVKQFVVLPTRGLQASAPTSSASLAPFLMRMSLATTATAARSFAASAGLAVTPAFRVLDSIHEDGAKLVEMTPETAKALTAQQPGLRVVPVVYYKTAVFRAAIDEKVKAKAAGAAPKVPIRILSDANPARPIVGATVVAFIDFANRIGAQGTTNSQGLVSLSLGSAKKLERIYVYPKLGFWGALRRNVSTTKAIEIKLTTLDLGFPDALRFFSKSNAGGNGMGVKVAVVDTGVGPHADLTVTGGLNTVEGELSTNFGDNGAGHGTHVGGIIAAHGVPPTGISGLAPKVQLFSYRVFGKGAEGASNFSIAKAIDRAVAQGCDLINLSLGGGPSDPATASAVHDARQAGTVVIAAAGNEDRSLVDFPGADPLCVAVSALGRKGTFPKGAVEQGDVAGPFGMDPKNFIGGFSNIGPEIDLTGPGVGIISTVPGGHATMSGTSMASPAVTGYAARILSSMPNLLGLPRDQTRSDKILAALLQSAKSLAFAVNFQGRGLPQP